MKRVMTLALVVMLAIMSKIATAEENFPNNWVGPTSEDIVKGEKSDSAEVDLNLLSFFTRGRIDFNLAGIWGIDSNPKENSFLDFSGELELGGRINRTELGGFPLEFSLLLEAVPLLLDGTGYNVQETLYLTGLRFRLWGETSGGWYTGITAWYPTDWEESDNITWLSGAGDFWGTIDLGYAEENWSLKFALGYPRSMARLDIVINQEIQWGAFLSLHSWGCPWEGGEHKLRVQDGTAHHEYLYRKYSGELGITWAPAREFYCEIYLMGGVQIFDPVSGGIDPPDCAFLGFGVRISWNANLKPF